MGSADAALKRRSEPAIAAHCGPAAPVGMVRAALRELQAALGSALVASIVIYRWTLGPLFGACCRFEPSCSRYTQVCIQRWGPLRGAWLGLKRLSRFHPFCPGGHDPPPELTF